MEALESLKEKLGQLLKKHNATRAENKKLSARVAELTAENRELNRKITSMEKGLVSVRLNEPGMEDEGRDNMRRQLDTVIADIDKLLESLND
jgi:uncharacterized coiled-coil DUF342 family protein